MELVTVLAIEALWEQLAMGPTLNAIEQRAGCFVSYERALLAMVVKVEADLKGWKLGRALFVGEVDSTQKRTVMSCLKPVVPMCWLSAWEV